jgi:hypothetical protein
MQTTGSSGSFIPIYKSARPQVSEYVNIISCGACFLKGCCRNKLPILRSLTMSVEFTMTFFSFKNVMWFYMCKCKCKCNCVCVWERYGLSDKSCYKPHTCSAKMKNSYTEFNPKKTVSNVRKQNRLLPSSTNQIFTHTHFINFYGKNVLNRNAVFRGFLVTG